MESGQQEAHLVVLHHGLWGNTGNLAFLESLLNDLGQAQEGEAAAPRPRLRVLNCDTSPNKKTYDGVDVCAHRLVDRLLEHVDWLAKEEGLRVTKLSFIGYSLGGLISRYAVGILYARGWLAGGSGGGVEPVNFVTVAAPHIGAYRQVTGLFSWLFNKLVPYVASCAGRQLVFKDTHALGRPLLINLADPGLPFMRGLRRFKKLMALANVHFDRMVYYRTASISEADPYASEWAVVWSWVCTEPAACPESYPSVVRHRSGGSGGCGGDSGGDPLSGGKEPLTGGYVMLTFLAVMLLLSPLMLLILASLVVEGGLHARRIRGRPDTDWITRPALGEPLGERAAGSNRSEDGAAGAAGGARGGSAAEPGTASFEPSGSDASIQVSLLDPAVSQKPAADGGAPTAPHASVAELQAWLVRNLNTLPWHKVDVDCRHVHAHAAIVVRYPSVNHKYDQLLYMLHNMRW